VKRRIRFTPPAQSQFLAAIDYVKEERPAAATAFRDRAFEALSRLAEFPDLGRVIPEYPALGFREVLVDSYRFF
jgi:plasmid stabilization system protein ParE